MAAGQSNRLGANMPKPLLLVAGKTITEWALGPFFNDPNCQRIIVVIDPHYRDLWQAMPWANRAIFVSGGKTRQESVLAGLEALHDFAPKLVMIHDAARPNWQNTDLHNLRASIADGAKAAYLAEPMVDSIHRHTPDTSPVAINRDHLWAAQTPQVFYFSEILSAHRKFAQNHFSDDVALAREFGIQAVPIAAGSDNFKITLPQDLEKFRMLKNSFVPKTGLGYDIHALGDGNMVTLGGVRIPAAYSLIGHSDADVVLHALCDALYGTCGAGDIGVHFPPSDSKWRGADSKIFVEHALSEVTKASGRIINIDVTILAETPKIGPHRQAMQQTIAAMLGLQTTQVNIKATTNEGIGAIGRNEGIAAMVQATVMYPW